MEPRRSQSQHQDISQDDGVNFSSTCNREMKRNTDDTTSHDANTLCDGRGDETPHNSPRKRSRREQEYGSTSQGQSSSGYQSTSGESLSMETCPSYESDSIDGGHDTLDNDNIDRNYPCCQLVHCNEPTVHVKYLQKGDKDVKVIHGNEEVISAIEACLNTGLGGVVTLKVMEEDLPKRKKLSTDHFDKKIDQHFVNSNQGELNLNIELEDYNPCSQTRKIYVKAGNQQKVLHQSKAYIRLNASCAETFTTSNHAAILTKHPVSHKLPKLPQGEADCVYGRELKFTSSESKFVEFKNCSVKNLDKDFEKYCGKYISGFANTEGGHIIYGVHDKCTVDKTIPLTEEEKFRRALHKRLQDMVWFHLHKGIITAKEGENFHVKVIPVSGVPDGSPPCMIVIVTIPRFIHGIVYYKEPQCPIIDPQSENGYSMMSCEAWCQYLKTLAEAMLHRQPAPYLKQFKQVNSSDADRPVYMYAVDKCSPSELRKQCLPFEEGKYIVWSDIPESEYPTGLQDLVRSCSAFETGVIIITNLARAFSKGHHQSGMTTDVLFISNQKGFHIITTREKDSDVIRTLDRELRNNCPAEHVAKMQFVMCHHSCTDLTAFNINQCPCPTQSFTMNEDKFDPLLEALVITLNTTSSSIAQIIGQKSLFVLTKSQCDLLWKKWKDSKLLFIHGLAGTGKTLMAHIIAKRLMFEDGDEAVLYVCENTNLKDYTSERQIPALTRCTFANHFRAKQLSRVRHLIFDEAQNYRVRDDDNSLPFDWFSAAKRLVQDNTPYDSDLGYILVFMDMSQKDHYFPCGLPSYYDQASASFCYLEEVVRNPVNVFGAIGKTRMFTRSQAGLWEDERWLTIYRDKVLPRTKVSHYVQGKVVEKIVSCLNPIVVARRIMEIVLQDRITIEVKNMVVLVSTKGDVFRYEGQLRQEAQRHGVQVVTERTRRKGKDCLLLDSVRRFSGLDAGVVIIVELGVRSPTIHCLKRLYTQGISRSMMNVYIITRTTLGYETTGSL